MTIKPRARSDVAVAPGGVSKPQVAPPSFHPDSRSWDSIEADESEAHAHRDVVTAFLDDDGVKVVSPTRVEEAGGDKHVWTKERVPSGRMREAARNCCVVTSETAPKEKQPSGRS